MRFRKKCMSLFSQSYHDKEFRKSSLSMFSISYYREHASLWKFRDLSSWEIAKFLVFEKNFRNHTIAYDLEKIMNNERIFEKQRFRKYWALFRNFRNHRIEYDFEIFFKDCEKIEFREKILIQESFEFEVQRTFLMWINYPENQACHKEWLTSISHNQHVCYLRSRKISRTSSRKTFQLWV